MDFYTRHNISIRPVSLPQAVLLFVLGVVLDNHVRWRLLKDLYPRTTGCVSFIRIKGCTWEKKTKIKNKKTKAQIMERISRVLIPKIIIDFLCVAVVGFVVLMLHLYAEPYHRGFFCNDESISHPFHDSTVTNIMLYIGGLFIPCCVMLIGEYLFYKNLNGQSSTMPIGCVNFPWVTFAYEKIGIFLFGAAVNVLTTDVAKYTVGRLRPHFFDVCEPDIDCSLPENHHVYIENFTCTSERFDERAKKEARLSFPSGHSSFSTYVVIFLVLYIQMRMAWRSSKLLKHFLQFICLMLAWFTAMSRISNYKHHWSDVLCGILIGIIVSLITFICIGDFFKDKHHYRSCTMTTGALSTANNAETAMQVNNGTADHVR
ncbi:hypothetical protein PV328_010781 [Microctonus aethiopoides]|uniref:Phosphatidic acid phosphatase type 2/haloperoxidase domain-containing protein n=1 Tax=Microctonus aethiopoides TaxID=144406 RepID=A0AA39FIR8_9HYME|nr:hypothetical protein PV328_010781 [Microctonus aethiopoides]